MNYRGSLGYGQDNVLSLPGNIGTQDVKDVQVRMQQMLLWNLYMCKLLILLVYLAEVTIVSV